MVICFQVLNEGYIMIRVDSYEEMNGSDWFCYHMSSPYIFPAGFCASHNITLSAPKGWDSAVFDWGEYLTATGCTTAPLHLFNRVSLVTTSAFNCSFNWVFISIKSETYIVEEKLSIKRSKTMMILVHTLLLFSAINLFV